MIVTVQRGHDITNSLLLVTKPFSWDLWLSIFVSFGAIGFLVWRFEREENEEFQLQGPWQRQLGTIFYLSYSLIVLQQRKS